MRQSTFCLASAIVAAGLLTSVSGCGPVGWTRVTLNRKLTPQNVAFIHPGTTKWRAVIKELGAPSELQGTDGGIVASYFYYDDRNFGVDFGWPLNFFPPASYAPHSMELRNAGVIVDTFQVAFDKRGVVQYDAFSHRTRHFGFRFWPFGNILQ